MNRKLRPTKSTQQIKEEQINFLLEDVKKNLEEYKKAIKIKDKQLSDIKKYSKGPKKSCDSVVNENTELKKYIKNVKQRHQQYQEKQQQEYLIGKKNTLGKNNQKNIKKLYTRKRVTVNLKQKRVNMYPKRKKTLRKKKKR